MNQQEESSRQKPRGRLSRQQENKEQLSQQTVALFQKIVRDGAKNTQQLPLQKMLEICEKELARLSKGKTEVKDLQSSRTALTDNELTISVVGIQTRVILDEQHQEEDHGEEGSASKRNTLDGSREKIIIRRYENLVGEIDHNESEIRKFMDSEVLSQQSIDFANSLQFFTGMAQRLKKLGGDKIVTSRIKLLQVLTFFLREAVKRLQPEKSQKTKAEENNSDGSFIYTVNLSQQQIQQDFLESNLHEALSYEQVNKYSRYASPFLDEKMVELSGVCEQVTQLEIFSRTLQFSQLDASHRKALMRVVDVLMGLHNRVSYLSRKKPELMKELENAAHKMTFINERVEQFLTQLEQQGDQIVPLKFAGLCQKWKSQLTEHFSTMQSYLGRMSEVIISQDLYHTHNYRKFNNFINIVELFSKIMSGEEGALEQWGELVSSMQQGGEIEGFSEDQCRILRILDDCISMERSRYSAMRDERNEHTNRTNQQLNEQVSKLISDYERLKHTNQQIMMQNQALAEKLGLQERLKDELLMEVDERDKIIKNLSAKKISLEKKLANQINNENRSAADSAITNNDDIKKLEHEAQKYLEKSLLLAEQLKVSENERERLMQAAESDRNKYMRTYESVNRLRPEKDRLEIECEQLKHQMQTLRADNQRNSNRLNKMITDLNNQKSLLEMQLDSETKNRERLFQRLQLSEQRLAEYSKLMMSQPDHKDDGSIQRLERENERLRRQGENHQNELKGLEQQNSILRDDVSTLKFRLKELQLRDLGDQEEAYNEIKIKLEKTVSKNQTLKGNIEDLKSHEEQLEQQLRQNNKKLKDLQNRQRQFESERKRLTSNIEEGERRYQDMQRQIDELRHWAERQARNARDAASKRDMQVLDKTSTIGSLEVKIKILQEQLANKSRESENVSRELVDTKMKQYESTIETHKIIELKLEEQNRSLKKDLDNKIQIEVKLNSEIGRLAKQIDRMKAELDKYIRELTEKEMIIKMEREKLDEKEKQLRELEIKQKVRREHTTPSHQKQHLEADTPSQLDSNDYHEPLSRSSMRYDNYYNAKQYDRLKKQYSDFKKHATSKIQKMEEMIKNGSPYAQADKGQLEHLRRREAELINNVTTLESAVRNLEGLNSEMKDIEKRVRGDYDRELKRMKDHYESEMRRVNNETESVKRQLQSVQKPSQLERQKQDKFNELKRSVETLLNEKNKLQLQNNNLINQRSILEKEKFSWSQQMNNLREQIRRQNITIQNFEGHRPEDLLNQIANLTKERDLIRGQYQSMRQHLQEQTKRAVNFEGLYLKIKSDWEKGQNNQGNNFNIDYLLAKIKALEEALAAIGDELTDSKAANHEQNINGPAGSRLAQSRIVTVTSEVNEFHRKQEEWSKKEKVYIQELEGMSRQILSLKDMLNKTRPSERSIVTTLPENLRSSNNNKSTYTEAGALGGNRAMSHIRVDKFLQGKKRWEKIQFIQSLSRWNVPPVVCQEVEDLRLMFLSMSDNILTLNRQVMELQRILSTAPSMSNLLEYAFRILTYFSQIDPHSQEATRIRNELEKISRQNIGGSFFTVLEEYTVHLLQNNTIEEYKISLRVKAQELLEIKQKLQEVINRQIEQEQSIINRAQTTSSRIREPGHYTSTSFSTFRTTSTQNR